MALLMLFVAVPAAADPTAEDLQLAREHMDTGVRYMQDPAGPQWDEAYVEFKKAYELSDSVNALLNLAICAQKLELDGEAIGHYEELLSSSRRLDPRDRKQIKNDLAILSTSVVKLTVKLDTAVRLTDVRTPRQGKPLQNVYELAAGEHELGIHPGEHRFTATAEGMLPAEWTVALQNGAKVEHTFEMKPIPPPPPLPVMIKTVLVEKAQEPSRPVPLYVLAPGLLTLAAGGTMATFMILSSLKSDELDEARGVQPVSEQKKLRDDLVTYNLVADIGIGVTAAAAATTLILILTRPTVGGEPPPSEPAKKAPPSKEARFGEDWLLLPTAQADGGGALFHARF